MFESYQPQGEDFGVKYSFVVYPGGDPTQIKIRYSGQDDLSVPDSKTNFESSSLPDSNSLLHLQTQGGIIGEKIDAVYTLDGESKIPVEGAYELEQNKASFKIGHYDKTKILVIDPSIIRVQLRRATYYGSEGSDRLNAVTADNDDNIYVVGATAGKTALMSKTGAHQPNPSGTGNDDIIIAKFDSDLSGLISATYWGGSTNEEGFTIDLDNSNAIYIGGFQGNSGSKTMFLGSFTNDLTNLNWSKFFGSGGSGDVEQINDLVVAGNDIFAVGTTGTSGLQTTGDPHYGNSDAIIMKINKSNGNKIWARYYGNGKKDQGNGITVYNTSIYITGLFNKEQTFIAAYKFDGNLIQSKAYGEDLNSGDITVSNDGNFLVIERYSHC